MQNVPLGPACMPCRACSRQRRTCGIIVNRCCDAAFSSFSFFSFSFCFLPRSQFHCFLLSHLASLPPASLCCSILCSSLCNALVSTWDSFPVPDSVPKCNHRQQRSTAGICATCSSVAFLGASLPALGRFVSRMTSVVLSQQ